MADPNATAVKTQHPLAVTRTELVWEGKYLKGMQTECTRNQPSYFKLDVPTYTPFAASAAAFFFHLVTVKGHAKACRCREVKSTRCRNRPKRRSGIGPFGKNSARMNRSSRFTQPTACYPPPAPLPVSRFHSRSPPQAGTSKCRLGLNEPTRTFRLPEAAREARKPASARYPARNSTFPQRQRELQKWQQSGSNKIF